jgi:hypothetical protein
MMTWHHEPPVYNRDNIVRGDEYHASISFLKFWVRRNFRGPHRDWRWEARVVNQGDIAGGDGHETHELAEEGALAWLRKTCSRILREVGA